MTISTLLQILGACIGVIGSLFFAIGVMRQSVDSMANLSGTYFDFNPHRVPALAAQKADYLFGGGLIVISFSFNLLSFPFQNVSVGLSPNLENAIPWIAIPFTVVVFIALLACSRIVSARYEKQIQLRLKEKKEEHKRQSVERRRQYEHQNQ